jgi:hypothetical protein
LTTDKKRLRGIIIYIVILGTYLTFAITTVHQWRQNNTDNSRTVYITNTGAKYHNSYHYHGRNYAISLFEAVEKGYTPCGVCKPPLAPTYSGKPGFYFYNWFIVSVLFSFVYWYGYNRLNKNI